jgi:peptide deformylase
LKRNDKTMLQNNPPARGFLLGIFDWLVVQLVQDEYDPVADDDKLAKAARRRRHACYRVRFRVLGTALLIFLVMFLAGWLVRYLFTIPPRSTPWGIAQQPINRSVEMIQPQPIPIPFQHIACLQQTKQVYTTMSDEPCMSPVEVQHAGLISTSLDCNWRYIVARPDTGTLLEMLNPSYVPKRGSAILTSLEQPVSHSMPIQRQRFTDIRVEYIDATTLQLHSLPITGPLALCIQHTIDVWYSNF